MIDFESTRGGSADWDFTKIMLYVWDRYTGTKDQFIEGYESIRPLPPVFETMLFYRLFNAVGGVAWVVRRGGTDKLFLQENLRQLDILLRA